MSVRRPSPPKSPRRPEAARVLDTIERVGALLVDSLALAEASLGQFQRMRKWTLWVKVVRWLVSGGRLPAQGRSPARFSGA
jgi:hypothetical protein